MLQHFPAYLIIDDELVNILPRHDTPIVRGQPLRYKFRDNMYKFFVDTPEYEGVPVYELGLCTKGLFHIINGGIVKTTCNKKIQLR